MKQLEVELSAVLAMLTEARRAIETGHIAQALRFATNAEQQLGEYLELNMAVWREATETTRANA